MTKVMWMAVPECGPGPNGRHDHTTNVVGSKLFIFGGQIGGKVFNDMWSLDLNSRTFACCCSEPFRPGNNSDNMCPFSRGTSLDVSLV